MAGLHDPRAHEKGHVDAEGFIAQKARGASSSLSRRWSEGQCLFANQQKDAVVISVKTAFAGKIENFRHVGSLPCR